MADGIITSCNVAQSWHWFRQLTELCNVACVFGIMTVNSSSGSTLQCDTWLWDNMPILTSCRFSRWRISAILDLRGPIIIGSLKSPCTSTTSYRSLIETIALNCLVFEKIAVFCILETDRQTDKQIDEQMDSTDALSRSCCRERRFNMVQNS